VQSVAMRLKPSFAMYLRRYDGCNLGHFQNYSILMEFCCSNESAEISWRNNPLLHLGFLDDRGCREVIIRDIADSLNLAVVQIVVLLKIAGRILLNLFANNFLPYQVVLHNRIKGSPYYLAAHILYTLYRAAVVMNCCEQIDGVLVRLMIYVTIRWTGTARHDY
jgi:hypothetical protein